MGDIVAAAVLLVSAAPAPALAGPRQPGPFKPRPLSAFDRNKAELLLRNRYPCLGCHQLNGSGGRIGPSLTDVGARRSPQYVYAMISDPQRTAPGTIMPRIPMIESTRELIASYLLQGAAPVTPAEPARPSGRPAGNPTPAGAPAPADVAALYGRFCAACHGAGGRGNGANAAFLPVRPTAHTSAAAMSARSDDALFDTIFAGGYVMNRSAFMPPFGLTLTREQIWALVRYIRSLCRCQGPGWSRDNR